MRFISMTKFELVKKIKQSKPISKAAFIAEKCSGKKVLDMGCIRHNADVAMADPNWLHAKIKARAQQVVGVDYLPEEIPKVNSHGYDVRYGDVTQPIDIHEKFDVIVAADLIEHLTNFDGFFKNCNHLLAENGVLIITTPNPFYVDSFHFVSLK